MEMMAGQPATVWNGCVTLFNVPTANGRSTFQKLAVDMNVSTDVSPT